MDKRGRELAVERTMRIDWSHNDPKSTDACLETRMHCIANKVTHHSEKICLTVDRMHTFSIVPLICLMCLLKG